MTEIDINNDEALANITDDEAIDIIKNLRDSTVSKDEFTKLKETNRKLMKTLAEGGKIDDESAKPKSIPEMRKALFIDSANDSNLTYVTKMLELRTALIEDGQTDPFVAQGREAEPTPNDYATAENVAKALQGCVDAANGDPAAFNANLARVLRK